MRGTARAVLTSGLAWLVGAAGSVAVGLTALSLIGVDLTAPEISPLTSGDVAAAPVAAGPSSPPPAPVPTGSPTPTPSQGAGSADPQDTQQLLRSDGGFVVARCQDGLAYLVSWTPEQDYEAHDVRRGPAAVASVEFEGGGPSIQLDIHCENDVPFAQESREGGDDEEHESDDD